MPNDSGFSKNDVPDKISALLDAKNLVPEKFRGTDKYLDVISWNIRWFDASDADRVKAIADVLGELNADFLVLTEIAADGALAEVVTQLAQAKAGFYSTHYGTTGQEQRLVLMWDRDWVRAKAEPTELFKDEDLRVPSETGGKDQAVFPRLPVWGYFEALASKPGDEGFTFELVGVHLKAQGPKPTGYKGPDKKRWGIPQRTRAAERLGTWLTDDHAHFDADVIVIGDWNATPDEVEWQRLRDLEAQGEIRFKDINKTGEVSHLVRLNASGPAGSRIDLHLITREADANAVPKNKGLVIQWKPFDNLSSMVTADRTAYFKALKARFSDHLPVLTRFYLTEKP
jgi:endonuclease/exonuclease/phosphatase family metal-dependent hydrolase